MVVLDGYKDNSSLNHLKQKVPCWETENKDDVIVCNPYWKKIIISDDPIIKMGGCYLPKKKYIKFTTSKKEN